MISVSVSPFCLHRKCLEGFSFGGFIALFSSSPFEALECVMTVVSRRCHKTLLTWWSQHPSALISLSHTHTHPHSLSHTHAHTHYLSFPSSFSPTHNVSLSFSPSHSDTLTLAISISARISVRFFFFFILCCFLGHPFLGLSRFSSKEFDQLAPKINWSLLCVGHDCKQSFTVTLSPTLNIVAMFECEHYELLFRNNSLVLHCLQEVLAIQSYSNWLEEKCKQ